MSNSERKSNILLALQQNQLLRADELAARFGVSEDTIRRDLRGLAEEGLIRRVYGGALPPTPTSPLFADRLNESVAAKSAIVEAAVALVQPNQTLILDAGTTVAGLAAALPVDMPLTVITHSLPAAVALIEKPKIEVILLGGKILRDSIATMGSEVIVGYGRYRADLCFLGITSFDATVGVGMLDYENAEVKRAMLSASAEVIALAAPEKIGTSAPFLIGPVSSVSRLITQSGVDAKQLRAIRKAGVEVIIV